MAILPEITSQTQWKPVKGYENAYAVSDSGHVMTIRGWCDMHADGRIIRWMGRLLSPQPKKKYGYIQYYLGDENGERHIHQAHRLVYETFIGDVPDGYEVDHCDDSPTNNHVSNLQPLTHKQNIVKSWRGGRRYHKVRRGSAHQDAKITEADIADIFKLASEGATQREIGKIYNLSHVAVGNILRGKTWKHESDKHKPNHRLRHSGKLTAKDVIRIRQLAASGVSAKMIADYYKLTLGHVYGVINRRFWPTLSHQIPMFQEA